jgi:hypothetical protein
VKGGSVSDNIWAIRLQLTKPVTWIPLVWGVMCGAAASGNYHWYAPPRPPAPPPRPTPPHPRPPLAGSGTRSTLPTATSLWA